MNPWQAVHEQFNRGGSILEFLLTFVLLIAFAGGVVLLFRLQQRGKKQVNDPHKLFHNVVRQLPLGVRERDLLRSIMSRRRVEHPTALLLSSTLFDAHVATLRASAFPLDDSTLTTLRRELFGDQPTESG